MFRSKFSAYVIALLLVGVLGNASRAGFTLIGPSFGGVTVNPFTPGGTPGNTTVATGIVSSSSFVTWSNLPDSTQISNNTLGTVLSAMGTPAIAAVTLVSNSPSNPTQTSPTPLSTTGNSLERRTNGYSFSAQFSSNEALLMANAANAALIIDFAVPVSAAGFRVQADQAGTNNTFFLQGFNSSGSNYSPTTPLYSGNTVDTGAYTGAESSEFYGIMGTTPSSTFTRLWIGFSGPTSYFAISTLEFVAPGGTGPVGPGAVPAPPTFLAAGLGLVSLRWIRRRKSLR